ncbi:MAG TPA: hypothetical protein VNL77_04370, partial [Roseiflexaceae bacterium]|nr:hypothetical protein [Roseiflexaceae bacterium]
SDSTPPEEVSSAAPPLQPAITPAATVPPPTPTPEIRQGRIVGLGGATGFMHEPAGFNTPTLPPPLPEGTVVTLLDMPPTTAEDTIWVKVSYGGYEGWVPQNNVEAVTAPAATPGQGAGP